MRIPGARSIMRKTKRATNRKTTTRLAFAASPSPVGTGSMQKLFLM